MKSFIKSLSTILLSLLVMALWGSLYPLIKIGYTAFSIHGTNIPSILMFAGTRFAVCGAVVTALGFIKKEKMHAPKRKTIAIILLIGFFSIILHYGLYYIGVSSTDSSKAALIKQLGSLLYICFAFLFFKNETFNIWKIIGAIVGFLGIFAINFTGKGIYFSFGDILIMSASICTVVASIFSKTIVTDNSPFWITGISQLFGGLALMLISFIMGGSMLAFDWYSFGVFAYICTASTTAYLLWNYILKTNELSKLFIIKFAEPLFACILGAILLGENILKWQYLIAFILISTGIVLGNKTKKETKIQEKDNSTNEKEIENESENL